MILRRFNLYLWTGFLLFAVCINVSSDELNLQTDAKDIISHYKAVFTSPPKNVPSNSAVDAPLLGNGDVGVCVGGPPESQRYWLSKNDFWRLKSLYGSSGPRVFGGIDIDIPALKNADYFIEQNLYDATTVSTFTQKDFVVRMRSRVLATHNIVVIELTTDKSTTSAEVKLWAAESDDSESLQGEGNQTYWVSREFKDDVDLPVKAACAMKLIGASEKTFTLTPGKPVTIIAVLDSSFKHKDCLTYVQTIITDIDEPMLGRYGEQHEKWWQTYWNQSFVTIGDPLIEQRYYLSQYVMGSCSRDPEFPPPIFGTWITTDTPSWFGDYHLNYNHMAPFYALYSSNHIEQADPFHAPILDFVERGQWYAKNILNCRGVYFPVGIGPKGIETTRDCQRHADWHKEKGGLFYGQKSNAAYCLVTIAPRWYRTYDLDYANKLYPFVLEVVSFWEDYLKFDNGRYVIYNDAIHEGSGNNKDFNPILSLGLIRNAFKLALSMSASLNTDKNRHEKWMHILTHLSKFPTQEKDGKTVFRYTEKGTKWWGDNTLGIQHIYPSGAIGLEDNTELLEISRNTIDAMNRWIDNNGMNSFFPAAVRVGYDSETILTKLHEMIQKIGGTNGFIRNNPHGIENCSIVPNTINEMLCMGHQHVLRLFSVWPKDHDARFHQLRVEGAFLVSSELQEGKVLYAMIHSEKGRPCTMQNPWPDQTVILYRDGKRPETLDGNRITFDTKEDEELLLISGNTSLQEIRERLSK
jgi:alpha-L-fucosidase 2